MKIDWESNAVQAVACLLPIALLILAAGKSCDVKYGPNGENFQRARAEEQWERDHPCLKWTEQAVPGNLASPLPQVIRVCAERRGEP